MAFKKHKLNFEFFKNEFELISVAYSNKESGFLHLNDCITKLDKNRL